jgi:predicted GNAT superfamily acetyltransferase
MLPRYPQINLVLFSNDSVKRGGDSAGHNDRRYDACVRLQREVFGLPDLEISPRRHLSSPRRQAAGHSAHSSKKSWSGSLLHLPAVRDNDIFGYSHMMAVDAKYQNQGVGARLKWAQRARALSEGRNFIKWTFEPIRARNAHLISTGLGVVVRAYAVNFYGTDYATVPRTQASGCVGIMDSDRLFASWELRAPRVEALADGREDSTRAQPEAAIEIRMTFPHS